jgi:uncharacterized RDD family membrane protein YckC
VNTICSQCGSVLASGVYVCNFCSFESPGLVPLQDQASPSADKPSYKKSVQDEWRGELTQRFQAYHVRKKKKMPSDTRQSAFSFEESTSASRTSVTVQEQTSDGEAGSEKEDFAFTIAIGRIAQKESSDSQVLIDVSNPPGAESTEQGKPKPQLPALSNSGLPVASIEERRRALWIDAACLAFAYGSFLALFGSLGGHFTLSKLSAAVCASTFAFVYVQYFALFTIFGGSTPGMMLSGLHVASVTGDVPTPRQHLLRAIGYVLSAGTGFLGFLWVFWDEDGLTWHDRISQTYVTPVERFGEEDASSHALTAR